MITLLVLASAAATFAGTPGTTWPHAVRVYNPTGWQIAVESAVDALNRSGAGARFELLDSEADADVVVIASTASWPRSARKVTFASGTRRRSATGAVRAGRCACTCRTPRSEPRGPAIATATAAHELGHVLGLERREGCSIMNSKLLALSCREKTLYPTSGIYLCGPMPADVDRVAALYGGSRAPGYRPDCVKR